MLRNGYQSPSRKQIADKFLDSVYDQLQSDMKNLIDGKTGTLVQDGWSNIYNEPIIASSLQVESKSYLLDSDPTGSMTKTSENYNTLCQESIQKAKDTYNCSVSEICTDNPKTKTWNGYTLPYNRKIQTSLYGCSANWLNLLGQDLTTQSVMKHIVELQKYFRNHHEPCAWLIECLDSRKPQLPGETRRQSQLTCLDRYITNRPSYMKIVQDHEDEIDQNIAKKGQDINIFRNAKDLADQLRPVANAIDCCQADNASLAAACDTCYHFFIIPNSSHLHPKTWSSNGLQTIFRISRSQTVSCSNRSSE